MAVYMCSLEKCKAAQSVHINGRLVDTFECQHMNRLRKSRIAFIFLTAMFDSYEGKFAFVSIYIYIYIFFWILIHNFRTYHAVKAF